LVDRSNERAALDRLLADVRAGHSGVLVLRGEAGIGKTALLDYLVDRSAGCRIARAVGVQAEAELAFAGLQQLCGPLLGHLDRLPAPQRAALGVAFGLSAGSAPDPFLVGLGVLGLLSDSADERPVVSIVDDAQWLDRASAKILAFVARRLLAEAVALVFAVRDPGAPPELNGLPELIVHGLDDADARALLASVTVGRLDDQVLDRIVAETRGNPLALLELPNRRSIAEIAGGFGLEATSPVSMQIEESFLRRLRSLPQETQRLLLIAAAEPTGNPTLLWRASALLGLSADAAAPAEAAGLVELGATVRFRHPLVRSAISCAAPLTERRAAHQALAEATDGQVDPDRRAWHRAQAALGPDDDVADELERSAERARARGGLAAAAAFLERAAALTSEPGVRARRALFAADATQRAGAPQAALRLLAIAEIGPLDGAERARLGALRGEIAFQMRHGRDAPPLLLAAARKLEACDPELARAVHLEAMFATITAGRFGDLRAGAEAARAAPRHAGPPNAADVLLEGLAGRFAVGYTASAPTLKRAVRLFRDGDVRWEHDLRLLPLACAAAAEQDDDDAWYALATREIQDAREGGALSVLPRALVVLGCLSVLAGDLDGAAASLDEADTIADATGSSRISIGRLLLAAYRGEDPRTAVPIETWVNDTTARGEGLALTALEHARAVLQNGLGRYAAALSAAQQASARDELLYTTWALRELVEAAARAGQSRLANAALARVSERARASGTEWALGVDARCRALVADGARADDLYREAIDRLGRCRVAVELARARLLYGEWLRRKRRRVEAREQLRMAHGMFADMGVRAFAERARRELLATGERARRRAVEAAVSLTPQEAQVARMARDGRSNQEIGSQLFISSKTVEYHLHKAFAKLGISSRYQIERVLPRD
jgi:DNA-binding CsgD family transcriptional regulator